MKLPDNAHKECRELGMCAMQEHKGYNSCQQAGECLMTLAEERLRGDRIKRGVPIVDEQSR